MAYFLSGSVIISDGRELIGINTAGINTALFVGSDIQMDGASGIITATEYYGDGSNLTGVGLNTSTDYGVNNLVAIGSVTAANFYGDGSALINIPGLSWVATGSQTTRPDGTAIQDGDLYYDPDELRQFTYYDGDAGGWRDSNPAANSAVSVTVGLETALVIPGEDTLTFEPSPATGEIVIGINTTTDTLTFGIDDNLRVGTSLQVGAGVSIFGSTITSADGTPIEYFGDGSNLTGIGLSAAADIITTGDIQAGIITATTAFEATSAGVGLTVTGSAFIGSNLTVEGDVVTSKIQSGAQVFEIVDQFDLNGAKLNIEQGGGNQSASLNASATTRLKADHINNRFDIVAGGDLYRFDAAGVGFAKTARAEGIGVGLTVTNDAHIGGNLQIDGSLTIESTLIITDLTASDVTATNQLKADVATGVGLTVVSDAYIGGNLEVGAGNSVTAPFFYGDGSNLTGVGLATDSNIVTTGDIQAGVITATTSLEATVGTGAGTGVGLTVTSDAYIGGNVTVAGDLEANDVNTTSDVAKKENIQEIGDALSKVGQLKGVTFDWKESGQSSGGIIAQDVEKVLPTLVKDGEDHKTVIYNGIIGLLVQAVKELSAEVEELKQNK